MPEAMRRRLRAWLACLLLWPAPALHGAVDDYPVPTDVENMLFYLQRSMNANTVVYQARVSGRGDLDSDDPVRVFWLRFNTTGERKPLKWIERAFAYGVDPRGSCAPAPCVQASIVAYPDRPFAVRLDAQDRPYAQIEIGGRPARLQRVFLMLEEGFLTPDVKWIGLDGVDLVSGERRSERIYP